MYWGDYVATAIALLAIGFTGGMLVARQAIRTHYQDIADRRSAVNSHWKSAIK